MFKKFTDIPPDEIDDSIKEGALSSHSGKTKALSVIMADDAAHLNADREKTSPTNRMDYEKEKDGAKYEQRISALNSLFKDEVADIQKLIDFGDSDNMGLRFQKKMLKALIDILPLAEAKYRKEQSERAAYAMNSLITQCRELINDIQASNDRQYMAQRISNEVLIPCFTLIAQNLMNTFHYAKNDLSPLYKPDRRQAGDLIVNDGIKSVARFMSEMHKDMVDKIDRLVNDM